VLAESAPALEPQHRRCVRTARPAHAPPITWQERHVSLWQAQAQDLRAERDALRQEVQVVHDDAARREKKLKSEVRLRPLQPGGGGVSCGFV
jgi:hypothetical protein